MSVDERQPKGRWGPLSEDHPSVGQTCGVCGKPMQVGDVPSLVGDEPADEEERAKKQAGRAYTAAAAVVHESCVWPQPVLLEIEVTGEEAAALAKWHTNAAAPQLLTDAVDVIGLIERLAEAAAS